MFYLHRVDFRFLFIYLFIYFFFEESLGKKIRLQNLFQKREINEVVALENLFKITLGRFFYFYWRVYSLLNDLECV
jgi:hypothetical protein